MRAKRARLEYHRGRGGGEGVVFLLRGRGGACPARDMAATQTYRGNRKYGFPLGGKLSPQVTDEGALAGHFPLIRRAPRATFPQRGEGFPDGTQLCVPYKPTEDSQSTP